MTDQKQPVAVTDSAPVHEPERFEPPPPVPGGTQWLEKGAPQVNEGKAIREPGD